MVLVENRLYDRTGAILRVLSSDEEGEDDQRYPLLTLVKEVVEVGQSVLIFCPTKQFTRSTAVFLSEQLEMCSVSEEVKQSRSRLSVELETMQRKASDLSWVLKRGVGYHHSGIPSDEREIVENAYRSNIIQVI
jgi:replicative superfamily II helicase